MFLNYFQLKVDKKNVFLTFFSKTFILYINYLDIHVVSEINKPPGKNFLAL